jgi:hypothetical protein
MAAIKIIFIDTPEGTGQTVYTMGTRKADGFLFDDGDGDFASSPADPYLAMTEDSTIKGRYTVQESRTVWDNGEYNFTVYKQNTDTAIPASDSILGGADLFIIGDKEVNFLDVGSIQADVNSLSSQVSDTQAQVSSLSSQVSDTQSTIATLQGTIGTGTVLVPNPIIDGDTPLEIGRKNNYNPTFYLSTFSSFASTPVWFTGKERIEDDDGDALWTVQGTVSNTSSMSVVFSLDPNSHTNQELSKDYISQVQFRSADNTVIANAATYDTHIVATVKLDG